jgi:cytoskeleton protein RodZ
MEVAAVSAPSETESRGQSRITINAKSNSWIQVRDDNSNTMLVTRLLTAGDQYVVPDQPGLVLLTGNAGALEVIVDGDPVPSIGGVGVVRRGVVLDVDRLKAGTAVSN